MASPSIQKVTKAASLRERIGQSLADAIISGELAPGTMVSVPALAVEFGVSATPVREAILDLEQRGFVQSVANTMGLTVQRSLVERELRDSSTRLDLSLGAGGLGLWSWEREGDWLTFNARALEMYGLRPETYSGIGADFVAKSPADGYASLKQLKSRAGEKRTTKSIKREVHKALDRTGYNPHTGPTLIQSWLTLHRKIGKEELF